MNPYMSQQLPALVEGGGQRLQSSIRGAAFAIASGDPLTPLTPPPHLFFTPPPPPGADPDDTAARARWHTPNLIVVELDQETNLVVEAGASRRCHGFILRPPGPAVAIRRDEVRRAPRRSVPDGADRGGAPRAPPVGRTAPLHPPPSLSA